MIDWRARLFDYLTVVSLLATGLACFKFGQAQLGWTCIGGAIGMVAPAVLRNGGGHVGAKLPIALAVGGGILAAGLAS